MSWRESRLAREDQSAYFVAEKAPQVELVEVRSVLGTLLTQFRNVGESAAHKVIASATTYDISGGNVEAPPDRPSRSASAIVIYKGQVSQIPVSTSPKVQAALGLEYVELVRADQEVVKAPPSDFILLTLEYEDVRENRYIYRYPLVLRRR